MWPFRPLPDVAALAALLEHRVQLEVPDAHLSEALSEEAFDHLDSHCCSRAAAAYGILLAIILPAMAAACDADAETVARSQIDAAIGDWASHQC